MNLIPQEKFEHSGLSHSPAPLKSRWEYTNLLVDGKYLSVRTWSGAG